MIPFLTFSEKSSASLGSFELGNFYFSHLISKITISPNMADFNIIIIKCPQKSSGGIY
jgi:hypothetical protein